MKRYHRSNEPLVWLPFIMGGGIAAMFAPALIFVTGLALPLGATDGARLAHAATHFIGRLFLLSFIPLCLIHAAHRFRFTLLDLGVHAPKLVAAVCYGGAIVGSLLAAWLVLTV